MVDLQSQYACIKNEVDKAIIGVIESGHFINGAEVKKFSEELAEYNAVKHVIPCANGTDALQIAMMALGFEPGDEIILPAFTYVAAVEVIALLHLKPVFVDVLPSTFELDSSQLKGKLTSRTKAIVPVHLYGQCCNMEAILDFAEEHNLAVIEDAAQAIGAEYKFNNGEVKKAGTMGDIGTTSFFPSKNLGCYGDGGAVFTNNDKLAEKLNMIANHGQRVKYVHESIGVNSRLDTLQASILSIKLKHLNQYNKSRNEVADRYDSAFNNCKNITIPERASFSTHVFHQYTLKIENMSRDGLKKHLADYNIPSMIYYPKPLHLQKAYCAYGFVEGDFPVSENLCTKVLSLPIHTEMSIQAVDFIIKVVKEYCI